MDMELMNEIIKIVIAVVGLVFTYIGVPLLKKVNDYINKKYSKTELENIDYWIKKLVNIAEDMYTEKNQGELKKTYVIKWIRDNLTPCLTEVQLSMLIDGVVSELNKSIWQK